MLVEHVGADPGLHGDHRHRVGDDVVQLASDAQALLGDPTGRALRARPRPVRSPRGPGRRLPPDGCGRPRRPPRRRRTGRRSRRRRPHRAPSSRWHRARRSPPRQRRARRRRCAAGTTRPPSRSGTARRAAAIPRASWRGCGRRCGGRHQQRRQRGAAAQRNRRAGQHGGDHGQGAGRAQPVAPAEPLGEHRDDAGHGEHDRQHTVDDEGVGRIATARPDVAASAPTEHYESIVGASSAPRMISSGDGHAVSTRARAGLPTIDARDVVDRALSRRDRAQRRTARVTAELAALTATLLAVVAAAPQLRRVLVAGDAAGVSLHELDARCLDRARLGRVRIGVRAVVGAP